MSLGVGYALADITGVIDAPLNVDLAFQMTVLENRVVRKADGYAPEGDYQVNGVVFNAALSVHHNF